MVMVKTRKLSSSASVNEEKDLDRISMLPDALIHQIMSFNDTKYAVQSSVLSKRWIHIWKSLPVLNFDKSSFSEENTKRFIEFAHMVFIFRDRNINIQKLSVTWVNSDYDNMVPMSVNIWVAHAVKCKVQEISIVITECNAYEIHNHLLGSNSLTKLELMMIGEARYVDIILPGSMNLPQLKELYLYGLSISGEDLSKRLFSNCPVLEKLFIVDCNMNTDNRSKLIVESVSLKEFEYGCRHKYQLPQNGYMANNIKLCAPNLEEFTIRSFLTQDYSLEICSPPSSVTFDMSLEEDEYADAYSDLPLTDKDLYARRTTELLGAVCKVKKMILSPGFLEVLSQAPDLLDNQPPRFCNLESLVLEMWPTRGCLRAIAYVLNNSPNLIKLGLVSKEIQANLLDVADDWKAGLSSPGMLSNLKYVQAKQLEGCDAELKILILLVTNAKVLETVALSFCSSDIPLDDRVRQIGNFLNKIRAVPTASSSITWGLMR